MEPIKFPQKFIEYRDKFYKVFGDVWKYEAFLEQYEAYLFDDEKKCMDVLLPGKNYEIVDEYLNIY